MAELDTRARLREHREHGPTPEGLLKAMASTQGRLRTARWSTLAWTATLGTLACLVGLIASPAMAVASAGRAVTVQRLESIASRTSGAWAKKPTLADRASPLTGPVQGADPLPGGDT